MTRIDEEILRQVKAARPGKVYDWGSGVVLGADPEMFWSHVRGLPAVAEALGLPAKHERWVAVNMDDRDDGVTVGGSRPKVGSDGLLFEFQLPATWCGYNWVDSALACMQAVQKRFPNLRADARLAMRVPDEVWATMPESCKVLGCEPSENAWGEGHRIKLEKANQNAPIRLRSVGGHIHIGVAENQVQAWKWGHARNKKLMHLLFEDRPRLVQALDLVAGTFIAACEAHDPAARERRQWYGEGGCYRPQEWGLEWRVPSSLWMQSPSVTSLMYQIARGAVLVALSDLDLALYERVVSPDDVIRIINNCDRGKAVEVWERMAPYLGYLATTFTTDTWATANVARPFSNLDRIALILALMRDYESLIPRDYYVNYWNLDPHIYTNHGRLFKNDELIEGGYHLGAYGADHLIVNEFGPEKVMDLGAGPWMGEYQEVCGYRREGD